MCSRSLFALATALALGAAISAPSSAAPVREEVLSFVTHDGLELGALLTLPPRGEGPFPGVLLIHGSGLHDADHEVDIPNLGLTNGRQEHFKRLAKFLSRKGFAVLRYNKRGASFDHLDDDPRLLNQSTFDDLVEDARSALAALYADRRVDARRLVVWGWSEGSMIAPRLARSQREISLLVLVGPVARPMAEIARYQLVERYVDFYADAADENGDGFVTFSEIDRLDGRGGLGSFYVRDLGPSLYGLSPEEIASGADPTSFSGTLDRDGDGRLSVEGELLPVYEDVLERALAQIELGINSYNKTQFAARPLAKFIDRVRTPMLLVQGEADVQTTVEESEILTAKLEAAARTDWQLLSLPGLGHSLAAPNDFYREDGGLTTLDNPTLNAMKKRTMRRIVRAVRKALP